MLAPTSRHGGLLGRLGRVLERLGLISERLGGVLERLGRVLGRLGAENEPSWARHVTRALRLGPGSVQDRSSAWPQGADNIKRRRKSSERKHTENLRDSADQVTANPDTQLGAFGPGADIQSAAERRARHRAWIGTAVRIL